MKKLANIRRDEGMPVSSHWPRFTRTGSTQTLPKMLTATHVAIAGGGATS